MTTLTWLVSYVVQRVPFSSLRKQSWEDLTPIPKARTLVNVGKYNTFDSALRNAPFMVEASAVCWDGWFKSIEPSEARHCWHRERPADGCSK